MMIGITALTPRIGSALDIDVGTLLSGSASAEIRALLEQRASATPKAAAAPATEPKAKKKK